MRCRSAASPRSAAPVSTSSGRFCLSVPRCGRGTRERQRTGGACAACAHAPGGSKRDRFVYPYVLRYGGHAEFGCHSARAGHDGGRVGRRLRRSPPAGRRFLHRDALLGGGRDAARRDCAASSITARGAPTCGSSPPRSCSRDRVDRLGDARRRSCIGRVRAAISLARRRAARGRRLCALLRVARRDLRSVRPRDRRAGSRLRYRPLLPRDPPCEQADRHGRVGRDARGSARSRRGRPTSARARSNWCRPTSSPTTPARRASISSTPSACSPSTCRSTRASSPMCRGGCVRAAGSRLRPCIPTPARCRGRSAAPAARRDAAADPARSCSGVCASGCAPRAVCRRNAAFAICCDRRFDDRVAVAVRV